MEWSRSVRFILIGIFLLSCGGLIQASRSSTYGCENPQVFLSFLDLNRYNSSKNPYIDSDNVVNEMVDFINRHKDLDGVPENIHHLVMLWAEVCEADDPQKEILAWKDLAKEIHHHLHIDESIFKISKMIFGDRMVPWVMNPPESLIPTGIGDEEFFHELVRNEECIHRLCDIYEKHCGKVSFSHILGYVESFDAMCTLGVTDDEFTDAAKQTCEGYVYTPHPSLS